MSTLRRFAQANRATQASPGANASGSVSQPATPNAEDTIPITPARKPRVSYVRSPADTPSISSSTPFDWDAVRNKRPPPYGTPPRTQTPAGKGQRANSSQSKRIVKRKGIIERITSMPSNILFQISMFPHNVPMPPPRTSARLAGGIMHFLHLCVRISKTRSVPDSETGWEDLYHDSDSTEPWFDWTVPLTLLLLSAAALNALYVFTRTRIYRLHSRKDPVASPHVKFVAAHMDFEPLEPPSMFQRLSAGWSVSWRFLLNLSQPERTENNIQRVQQLEVWDAGAMETELLCVYSPVQSLLWMSTNTHNWMLMLLVMVLSGSLLSYTIHCFEALIKDKEIISAEVMSEYNEGFVYPRVNPIRKDVAVMTHQSEMVNVWED